MMSNILDLFEKIHSQVIYDDRTNTYKIVKFDNVFNLEYYRKRKELQYKKVGNVLKPVS